MRVVAIHTYPIKGCFRTDHREAAVEPWGLAGDRRFMITDDGDAMLTQRQEPGLVRVKPRLDGTRLVLRAAGHPDLAVDVVAGELVATKVQKDPIKASRVGRGVDDWLSTVLGRAVRLLWLDDPTRRPVVPGWNAPTDRVSLADEAPVQLANTASLAGLNDWLAEAQSPEWPVPMTRFRPNIVVDGAPAWAEDAWIGRSLRVGGMVFRAPAEAGRCVVTTTDQDTGERGREPLRTLARHRSVNQQLLFGLQLIPDLPGDPDRPGSPDRSGNPDQLGTVAVGDEVVVE